MRPGVIVAGGYSTRFGSADKVTVPVAGVPMIRRVAEGIHPVVDAVVVNCRADQRDAIQVVMDGYGSPITYAIDDHEGLGPVGGIATGLEAVDESVEHAFVVACDMPFVEASLVEHLFDLAEDDTAIDAVVPRSADGWLQVLHAVYAPRQMAAACRRALDADDRKILAPLSYLETYTVEPAELEGYGSARSFENVNTREELAAASATVERP